MAPVRSLWARCAGRINRLSISDTPKTAATTMGMTLNILPMNPGMNISGRKETRLVRTLKITGMATSRVPATAACSNVSPLRRQW